MAAAVSTPVNPKTTPAASGRRNQSPVRSPLSPSEPDNALAPRRPKCREVTSRYMSSFSSSAAKRSPSPLLSRPAGMMTPTPSVPPSTKRAQSAERRRPATTRPNSLDLKIGSCNGVEVPNAQMMLVTSARSLSVSFQGESFPVQVSKAKPAPSPISARKGTPEKGTPIPARGGDQADNSRPAEQQRWPGRLRQPNYLSRSVDLGASKGRLIGSGVNANSSLDCRSSIESRSCSNSTKIGSEKSDHPVNYDSESVSSCSTSESTGSAGDGRAQLQRARFWQESVDKLCRQPEPASPVSRTIVLRRIEPPKFIAPKKLDIDSKISSPKGIGNTRGQLSPIRGGALRPGSPSKLGTKSAVNNSPIRGASPSRARNVVGAVVNSDFNNTTSILSFAADIRRTKSGEHQMVEVHVLRILYNRLLQWRFANARADSALSAQKSNAEVSLHSAWVRMSQLLQSVRARRTKLQWLRQNVKIISILKGQIVYLEQLALIDRDFSDSMSGAIEALQASTLRLPVIGGARADIQKVKDAICSAVDVMQAMAFSIGLLLSKVSGVNSLVAELVNVAGNERALLGQCNHLLSVISALQVKECSLKTHFLQVEHDFPS